MALRSDIAAGGHRLAPEHPLRGATPPIQARYSFPALQNQRFLRPDYHATMHLPLAGMDKFPQRGHALLGSPS